MQLVVDRELVPELQVQRGSLFQFIGEVTQFQARALSRSPPHPTPSPLTLRGACSRSCSCGRAWRESWTGWTSSSTTRRCRSAAHSRRRWPPPPPRPEALPPRPTPPHRCSNEEKRGTMTRRASGGDGLARRSGHTRRVLVMWGWRARGVSAAAAAGARSLPRRGRRCQRSSHDGRNSSVHCKQQDPFNNQTPQTTRDNRAGRRAPVVVCPPGW